MAFKFKKGETVRQIVPAPIQGTIAGYELDKETGDVVALVEWADGDHTHTRYFREDEIETVPEA